MIPEIIYEDETILVCRKKAGVAVQTKRCAEPDMESILKNYRAAKGEAPYIGVVHRLDQPVEGVMVFAKTKEAAADLCRQISEKQADKQYFVLVEGVPAHKKAVLEDYLLRDKTANISKVVSKGTPGAKYAELSYELLETNGRLSILRIKLKTGRHHQIRVQLSHAGMPVCGDRKYNFRENINPSVKTLALCSCKIAFRHPKTRKKAEFEIDKPFYLT